MSIVKAAILLGQGKLEIRETCTPICPSGGVLVNVRACGICSTDVKMVTKGHRALVYPRILGHEISGVVAESRTKRFKEGDRVQVGPGLRCAKCSQCLRGSDNQCKDRGILGFTHDGGFAQYVAIPMEGPAVGALTILPGDVSHENATLAEPTACCINAQDRVGIIEGDTVLIIGAGPLGLLHAFVARHNGAKKIVISEVLEDRQATAVRFGADSIINPKKEDLFQAVMNETNEKKLDVVIFACSQTGLDERFIELLAPGGRISIFSGMSPLLSRVMLDLNIIHYNEIIITGSYGCTSRQNSQAISLIASGKFPAGELITGRFTLDNIKEGLEHTSAKTGLKSIVEVKYE